MTLCNTDWNVLLGIVALAYFSRALMVYIDEIVEDRRKAKDGKP